MPETKRMAEEAKRMGEDARAHAMGVGHDYQKAMESSFTWRADLSVKSTEAYKPLLPR